MRRFLQLIHLFVHDYTSSNKKNRNNCSAFMTSEPTEIKHPKFWNKGHQFPSYPLLLPVFRSLLPLPPPNVLRGQTCYSTLCTHSTILKYLDFHELQICAGTCKNPKYRVFSILLRAVCFSSTVFWHFT